MLKISDATALAVHATALLSNKPAEHRSTREVAGSLGVSQAHLAKVLQRLGRAGLVRSVRGPRGGFALAHEPSEITLMQVFEAIEGPFAPRSCLLGSQVCGGAACLMGDLLVRLNEQVRTYLAETTLSAVASIIPEAVR